jgi:hypothetical protein
MLVQFSHKTQKYQTAILGMIIISMVLIMSQISLHALMLQEKKLATYPPLSIATDISMEKHCAQPSQTPASQISALQKNQPIQCQSFLSITDSLSVNTVLSIDLAQLSSVLFYISFTEPALNKLSFHQLNIFNSIIKTFFPSISIKLHSFLI